jgi:hypothetical protein
MRVFLCKRRYMAKDVIVDRYARLNEIPRQLAITFGMFLAVPASCAACSKIYYQKTMRWRIY